MIIINRIRSIMIKVLFHILSLVLFEFVCAEGATLALLLPLSYHFYLYVKVESPRVLTQSKLDELEDFKISNSKIIKPSKAFLALVARILKNGNKYYFIKGEHRIIC